MTSAGIRHTRQAREWMPFSRTFSAIGLRESRRICDHGFQQCPSLHDVAERTCLCV